MIRLATSRCESPVDDVNIFQRPVKIWYLLYFGIKNGYLVKKTLHHPLFSRKKAYPYLHSLLSYLCPFQGPVKIYQVHRPCYQEKSALKKSSPPFFWLKKIFVPLFFFEKKLFAPFFVSPKSSLTESENENHSMYLLDVSYAN